MSGEPTSAAGAAPEENPWLTLGRAALAILEQRYANPNQPTEPKAVDPTKDGGYMPSVRLHPRPMMPSLGETPDWPADPALKSYTGAVYQAVRQIGKRVARHALQATLVLKSRDGTLTDVPTHPTLDAIENGNDFLTGSQVFETMVMHRLLAGDSYTLKLRDSLGAVVGLFNLPPAKTRKVVSEVGGELIRGVNVYPDGIGTDESYFFDRKDLVLSHATNPTDSVYGWPALRAAAYEVNALEAAKIWESDWFRNHCQPDSVVGVKIQPGQDTEATMRTVLARIMDFGREPGMPLVLPAEISYAPITATLADMQWVELQGLKKADILSLFGVNKYVASNFDNVGDRAQAAVAMDQFAESTLLPELEAIFSAFNRDLLARERFVQPGSGSKLYFDFPSPVSGDEEGRIESLRADAEAGLITKDEFREMARKLGPYKPGNGPGEFLWQSIGEFPLDASFIASAVAVNTPAANGPPAKAERSAVEVVHEPPRLPAIVRPLNPRALAYRAANLEGSVAARTEYWHEEMRARQGATRDFQLAVAAQLANQGARLVERWERVHGKFERRVATWSEVQIRAWGADLETRSIIDDLGLWDDSQEREEMESVIGGASAFAFMTRAERAATQLGIAWDVENPNALAWLREHRVQTAAYVNDTTRRRMARLIANLMADGVPTSEIGASLATTFKRLTGPRALMIGQTEAAAASGAGGIAAWSTPEAAEIVTGNTWITARDEDVREANGQGEPPGHRIDGETVPMGEKFSNGMRHEADPEAPVEMRAHERCTTAARVRGEDA